MLPTEPDRVLALDIGGTKLAAGVVAADGTVCSFESMPTRVERGPEPVMASLVGLARRVLVAAGTGPGELAAAGISCGGPLDPVKGVVYGPPPNLPGWSDVPVVDLVTAAFDLPTVLANDASAAALAESRFGQWCASSLAYVTISTGVGGGLVVDGKLFDGAVGNGGEPGHTPVDWRGRPCPCGAVGCAEAYVSGTSIAARTREAVTASMAAGELPPSLLTRRRVADLTAADLTAAVVAGDPLARQIWDDTVAIMTSWLTGLVNVWEPALLVLGGGVTNAGRQLLLDPVRTRVKARAMRAVAADLRIEFSRFGDRSGLMGAAAVALTHARPTAARRNGDAA